MSGIEPPEEYVPAFRCLAEFSDEQFHSLTRTAASFRNRPAASEFAARVTDEARLPTAAPDSLFDAILSMVAYAENSGTALTDLIVGVARSASLDLGNEQQSSFEARMHALLQDGPFRVWHKGFELLYEYDQVFLGSRILTDIRPVFGDDVDSGPKFALIVHSLRIDLRKYGTDHREYFAMDSDDLISLRNDIDRALEKEASFNTLFQSDIELQQNVEK